MIPEPYRAGGHFRALIDNAQQEMARARLEVARWYAGDEGAALHGRLADEFRLARDAILAVTGQRELLDNNPVIQESIRQRNPDTDAICSAIGYAEFKRRTGAPHAQAARCGDTNDRIDFVLESFGVPANAVGVPRRGDGAAKSVRVWRLGKMWMLSGETWM